MTPSPTVRIAEPMTMATDYLLAALACALARRLWRGGPGRARRLWAGCFAFAGLAALGGGTYHGMAPVLPHSAWQALRRTRSRST